MSDYPPPPDAQHPPQQPMGQMPPPQQPYPQQPMGGMPPQPLSDAEARQWGGLTHLLGGILGFLAPLIIWLVYKDRSPYVAYESKKALNFQLLALGGYIASSILIVVVIGPFLSFAVWVVSVIFGYINFQAVNQGRQTKYPVEVEIIK